MEQIITKITKDSCEFLNEKISFKVEDSCFNGMIKVVLGIPKTISSKRLTVDLYHLSLFGNATFFREKGRMFANVKSLDDLKIRKSPCAWANPCEH